MPDVPAIGEVLPGYEVALWNGLFLPSKTAPDVVDKLNEAINRILRQALAGRYSTGCAPSVWSAMRCSGCIAITT